MFLTSQWTMEFCKEERPIMTKWKDRSCAIYFHSRVDESATLFPVRELVMDAVYPEAIPVTGVATGNQLITRFTRGEALHTETEILIGGRRTPGGLFKDVGAKLRLGDQLGSSWFGNIVAAQAPNGRVGNIRVASTEANFVEAGVQAGDTLRTGFELADRVFDEYTIQEVFSETELLLEAGPKRAENDCRFSIWRGRQDAGGVFFDPVRHKTLIRLALRMMQSLTRDTTQPEDPAIRRVSRLTPPQFYVVMLDDVTPPYNISSMNARLRTVAAGSVAPLDCRGHSTVVNAGTITEITRSETAKSLIIRVQEDDEADHIRTYLYEIGCQPAAEVGDEVLAGDPLAIFLPERIYTSLDEIQRVLGRRIHRFAELCLRTARQEYGGLFLYPAEFVCLGEMMEPQFFVSVERCAGIQVMPMSTPARLRQEFRNLYSPFTVWVDPYNSKFRKRLARRRTTVRSERMQATANLQGDNSEVSDATAPPSSIAHTFLKK